jgi:glycogen operon protein
VYNHTGEGGLWDGTGDTAELLSFRGLDNAGYYALTGGNRHYWESTGCGNNLDVSKPAARRMILDSLRYWAATMGVDGFRFDLATVLGRSGPGFSFESESSLLKEIAAVAGEAGIEVIAEAWDISGYHVGGFPKGWAEWNGEYRDTMRRFLKGDGNAPAFAAAVNGDYARFHDQGGPQKSVNFITAHDGFTLMDLVSYNQKNNGVTWPFGPSDGGADNNMSWDSDGSQALRRQRLRNFLAVQMFSRGVPMTLGGDEFARTQNGNNNPYKIDSMAMWQNYDMIATSAPTAAPTGGSGTYHDNYGRDGNPTGKNGLFLFTRFLLALRREHPCLRQDVFGDFVLHEEGATPGAAPSAASGTAAPGDGRSARKGIGEVTHLFTREDGRSYLVDGDRRLQWRIDGSAVGDKDFLLCINMSAAGAFYFLPPARGGRKWLRLLDTAKWAESAGNFWPAERAEALEGAYWAQPWSVVAFQEGP